MNITKINRYEKAVVYFLNKYDGWELEWAGDKNLCYDAIGKTPKGNKCVIEMKFRNKYYDTKLLEKAKYDSLMALKDYVKIYYVSDPKGAYWFWLDKLSEMQVIEKNCPTTTLWNDKKKQKEVYLLSEEQASLITWHPEDKKGVYDDYLKK